MIPAFYQDRKTGQRVRRCGGEAGGNMDFVLVRGADNVAYYAQMRNLVPCDDSGKPDFSSSYEADRIEEEPDLPPEPIIPVVETRLNLNTASAEEIARRIPGVGYRIAKQIKERQLTLPGEVFRNFDQVRSVSARPNWDAIIGDNLIFLG